MVPLTFWGEVPVAVAVAAAAAAAVAGGAAGAMLAPVLVLAISDGRSQPDEA